MSAATATTALENFHEKKICVECVRPDSRLQVPVKGLESTIAKCIRGFEQNTFHNCWEYFVYLLGMPENPAYGDIQGCEAKVTAILSDWEKSNGEKATVAYLTCRLRQHRSIVSHIRHDVLLALGYSDDIPITP